MKSSIRILTFLALIGAVSLLVPSAQASALPYLGEWSNGRGEALVITAKILQFGEDKPLPYRDITRATDGQPFQLQITAAGQVNGMGKFLQVSCAGEKMRIVSYASGADLMHDENVASDVTWFRDK
ncbi:MAG: hypothetical protein QOE34_613 [Verrucomicrobiota bacterium]|jgi:hypothetical protein